LVGKNYWKGFLDWFSTTLVKENYIDPENLHLLSLVEKAEDAVKIITAQK